MTSVKYTHVVGGDTVKRGDILIYDYDGTEVVVVEAEESLIGVHFRDDGICWEPAEEFSRPEKNQ